MGTSDSNPGDSDKRVQDQSNGACTARTLDDANTSLDSGREVLSALCAEYRKLPMSLSWTVRPRSYHRTVMYKLEYVRAAFGPKLVEYVKHKSMGGVAGQKGSRYEDRFTLLKIGEAAGIAFSRNGVFSDRENVTFQSQAVCFVDDLVIFQSRTKTVSHFQAKNAAAVSWGKGTKSLASDFRNQRKLSKARGLKTNLSLVVSRKKLATKLRNNVPKDLKTWTTVVYFPPDSSLSALLKFSPMRAGLTQLLGPEPTDDRLVTVGRLLLGVWSEAGKATTLKKMIQHLLDSEAPLIRPLKPVAKLELSLSVIFDTIPDFQFAVERGFFIWKYGTTDRGCYREHCGSARFSAFAQRIIIRRPQTFGELEVELG